MVMLQWGRALDGAEMTVVDALPEPPGLLQWGRALDGAEMPWQPLGLADSETCFNGAAPWMARKC